MNMNQIWPDWEIVEKIGSGSYGSVYRAKRSDRGGTYYSAVKIITVPKEAAEVEHLRSSGMDEESITDYFQDYANKIYREIALMETLKGNTNIVSYEDHKLVEHSDGIGCDIYIRMQLLTPLLQYQKSHKRTTKDVVRLGCDLCNALELCEKHRIIHRDIKPENIFVSENGDFELGDFGIARTANATTYGTVAGTFFYMAPEVYRNQAYNATVDLYSLGLVLYQYLNNGRLPFLPEAPAPLRFGDNESANNQRLQGRPLPALKGVSARLSNVVLKACAYEPKDRYQTAAELRAALIAAMQQKQEMKTAYVPTAMKEFPETVCLNHSKKEPAWNPAPQKEAKTAYAPTSKEDTYVQKPEKGTKKGQQRFPVLPVLLGVLTVLSLVMIGIGIVTSRPDIQPEAGSSSAVSEEDETVSVKNAIENEVGYDSNGNKTKETFHNDDGSIYAWCEYEYDSNGNKTKETVYSADGNKTKETWYNADGSINCWWEYEYDSNGNVTKVTNYDADGSILNMLEYDSNGNVTKVTNYDADGSIFHWFENEYDSNGNKTKVTCYNADGSIWYMKEYDGNGNKTKEILYNDDGSIVS